MGVFSCGYLNFYRHAVTRVLSRCHMHNNRMEIFPFGLLEHICEVILSDSKKTLLEVFNNLLKMTASLYHLTYKSQHNIYTNLCYLLETIGPAQCSNRLNLIKSTVCILHFCSNCCTTIGEISAFGLLCTTVQYLWAAFCTRSISTIHPYIPTPTTHYLLDG